MTVATPQRRWRWVIAGAASGVALVLAGMLFWRGLSPPAAPAPPASPPAAPFGRAVVVVPAPAPATPVLIPAPPAAAVARPAAPATALASEAELVDLTVAAPTMKRLRENPRIYVLLFPDLETQGAALNRIAALVEKAGLPRDRLLDDEALAVAIGRSGDTAATWYFGHDYAGRDVARFLDLALRDGIRLSAAETWFAERYRVARAETDPDQEIAFVTVANADARADAGLRAAILRHEIGHGHFFTRPEIATHVLAVWRDGFSAEDRAAFLAFLGREGYDTANETLMANEAMAYLIFTPDPRLFSAQLLDLPEARVEGLRARMRRGFPPF